MPGTVIKKLHPMGQQVTAGHSYTTSTKDVCVSLKFETGVTGSLWLLTNWRYSRNCQGNVHPKTGH